MCGFIFEVIIVQHRLLDKTIHRLLLVVLVFVLVTASTPLQGLFSYAEELVIPEDTGEGYIIKLKEERSAQEEEVLQEAVETQEGLQELSCTDDVLLAEDAGQLQAVDAAIIEYVEVNHPVVLTASTPDDPYYEAQAYLESMEVPSAWEMEYDGQRMESLCSHAAPVVAVIDSGLDTGHEDIDAARVVPGKYFAADGVYDDTSDVIGHGTQVAGLMMATKNNGAGIAGLSSQLLVMPLKVTDDNGRSSEKQIIEAIHYATAQKMAFLADPSQGSNVQVINMSLEVVVSEEESAPQALREACQEAMDAGILIVCAGGNGGSTQATYPAQYTLGVGAAGYDASTGEVYAADSRILSEDNGEGFENKIWVCAPGDGLYAPTAGGGQAYTTVSGTSFAAPQVAALAAFCKSIDPEMDQASFKALLRDNAEPLTGSQGTIGDQDAVYGYGLVNYRSVLTALGATGGEVSEETGESGTALQENEQTEGQEDEPAGEPETPSPEENGAALTAMDEDPLNPANAGLTDKTTPADAMAAESDSEEGAAKLQAKDYLYGIDVSYWNDTINWEKVKAAGVKFAIVRVGYASLGTGNLNEDYMFDENIVGAYKAGIKVGVYIYSQATTPAEARAEANFVIKKIEPYRNYITLPLVMDMESPLTYNGSKTHWAKGNVSKSEVAANYLAFADTAYKAGYVPMFYTYTSWIAEHIGGSMSKITGSGYPFWLAEYPSTVGTKPPLFAKLYGALYKYDFWQYSDSGRVNGISTYVDRNRWYTDDIDKYQKMTSVFRGISISYRSIPAKTRIRGKEFTIAGLITSSEEPLKRVWVGVVSKKTGKWVDGYLYDERGLEQDKFNIRGANETVHISDLPAGEYYYRVYAYTTDGTVRRVVNQPFTVKNLILSDVTKPGTIKQGSNFTIRGKVETAKPIKRIDIGVVYKSSGNWVSRVKYSKTGLSTNEFDINKANSKVDFSSLKAGKYYYRVVIYKADGSHTRIINKAFTVKPVIKLKDYSAPTSIKKGDGYTLKGTITCTTKIKRVKVGVVSTKTGNWISSIKYDNKSVNAKSFNIARADNTVRFGKLPKGTYYYRIVVYPSNGSLQRVLNKRFTVR